MNSDSAKKLWTIKHICWPPRPGQGSVAQGRGEAERESYWIRPWYGVGGVWDEHQGGCER